MDETDKRILNLIQTAFPLDPEPFKIIAGQIGISEDDVITRISKLQESGIIRRIGAVFDPRKLGFVSTLCAARVPQDSMENFVRIVNACPGVTHNYRRNNQYNVWFTFIGPSEEALREFLAEIKEKTGIMDIISMRAVRTFKINARFEV
jgi:siroheme decarboxylase